MATTYDAQLTFAYDDLTTRNLNFSDVPSTALSQMKTKILQFNEDIGDGEQRATAFRETFISADGSPVAKISKAKYTITTEEVIYNGN